MSLTDLAQTVIFGKCAAHFQCSAHKYTRRVYIYLQPMNVPTVFEEELFAVEQALQIKLLFSRVKHFLRRQVGKVLHRLKFIMQSLLTVRGVTAKITRFPWSIRSEIFSSMNRFIALRFGAGSGKFNILYCAPL